ncbi:MAG: CpsD/CapB family tyrosine-protein kinase [Candidatus Omnitrophota bacterium]
MKPLGVMDYLRKISSRIVLVMAIIAISVMTAAYDRYHFHWGKEKAIVLLGLLIGVLLAMFLEYLDHTLRTGMGVKFYARMPFMGEIPPALKGDANIKVKNMLAHLKPEALMAETFRNLRVNLLFAAPEGGSLGALMIGSSVLGEGKSFIASNLAIAFTQAHKGELTLLVDADMRRGKQGDFFGTGTEKGLSTYLRGESTLDDSIRATSIPNLYVMSSGPHTESPENILNSEKLEELIQGLKAKYTRIVIDVPAVLDFDDILAWAGKCDNLLYVIGSGFTPLEEVNEAKKKLEGKAKITGAVLDNVAEEADIYYYWSYFKYYWQNKFFKMKHQK